MREEWNKGYEKGRDDYCCNGNCNQGRDCPLRKKELTDEEITQCLSESMDIKGVWGQPMMELNPVKFAKAILRKEQEK